MSVSRSDKRAAARLWEQLGKYQEEWRTWWHRSSYDDAGLPPRLAAKSVAAIERALTRARLAGKRAQKAGE